MDFDLTDEQRLLKESIDRFLADRYGFEQRRRVMAEPEGWSRKVWGEFAELGILGLPFPEEAGGFGGGPVEMSLIMEAFGRALVLEPYFACVVLAGGVLRRAAGAAALAEVAPGIAEGRLLLAYAQAERQARWSLNDVATRAERDGEGWRITGQKTLVLHGDSADQLIVSARTGGSEREREGIGLFLVDASGEGVSRRGYPTQDAHRAAEIEFHGARGTALGDPAGALPHMERAQDDAIAALCAEAVGCMSAMADLTVDYLKTRQQFGRPIGANQALQHRAVDMRIALEQARSMALFAAMMAGEDDQAERDRAIHAAKVQIGRSSRQVGQEAVQLHGGIGVTMEYSVGHYFKRTSMIERQFGDTESHLAALARLGGLVAA
jgi:pimeloyl-CoA dehydrogenase small subunit